MSTSKITTQKLHKVIQAKLALLSSKYSVSQQVDRTTYNLYTKMKGVYGVFSTKYLKEICEALDGAGIKYDNEKFERGFVVVSKNQ